MTTVPKLPTADEVSRRPVIAVARHGVNAAAAGPDVRRVGPRVTYWALRRGVVSHSYSLPRRCQGLADV